MKLLKMLIAIIRHWPGERFFTLSTGEETLFPMAYKRVPVYKGIATSLTLEQFFLCVDSDVLLEMMLLKETALTNTANKRPCFGVGHFMAL